jgi:hypothetical protein
LYSFNLDNLGRGINLGRVGAGMRERSSSKSSRSKTSKFASVGSGKGGKGASYIGLRTGFSSTTSFRTSSVTANLKEEEIRRVHHDY